MPHSALELAWAAAVLRAEEPDGDDVDVVDACLEGGRDATR